MGSRLSPASPRWYDVLPVLTTHVDCGRARHRITWRDGKLALEDHDALAERSLVALGAKPPMCLELLDAWRARRGSDLLRELLLARKTLSREELALRKARHEAEVESVQTMPQRMRAHVRNQEGAAERVRTVVRQADERLERENELWATALTDTLSPGMRRALALSIIVNMEGYWGDDDFRRKHARNLESALAALAGPVFERSARRWSRRDLSPRGAFNVQTRLLAPGETPKCSVGAGRKGIQATLSLPISWFAEVWARGMSLTDDYFVMGVTESSPDRMWLRTLAIRLDPDWLTSKALTSPALVTPRRRAGMGDWQLEWI